MIDCNLEDVKSLRREAELCELRLDHHQLYDLLSEFDSKIDYYVKLRAIIVNSITENFRLTESAIIGPFLEGLVKKISEAVLEGMKENYTGPNDTSKILEKVENEKGVL